jgi:hypothetical protein
MTSTAPGPSSTTSPFFYSRLMVVELVAEGQPAATPCVAKGTQGGDGDSLEGNHSTPSGAPLRLPLRWHNHHRLPGGRGFTAPRLPLLHAATARSWTLFSPLALAFPGHLPTPVSAFPTPLHRQIPVKLVVNPFSVMAIVRLVSVRVPSRFQVPVPVQYRYHLTAKSKASS